MREKTIYVSEKLKDERGNKVFTDKDKAKAYDPDVFESTAYECEHCKAIGINEVFISKDDADRHEMECIFNPDNKSIATSKWLGLELYPSYPRYERVGRDRYVRSLIGGYNRAYDTRTGDYLSDKDFYRTCKGWIQREMDSIGQPRNVETKRTKAYDKFVEILQGIDRDGKVGDVND